MGTSKDIRTLEEVAALLRSQLTGDAQRDAELNAAIAVCERVSGERAELLKAVERLSKRLKLSTNELSRLTRGLK